MKKPTRVLIVEDVATDADLAKRAICKTLKQCEFQTVETRKDFLESLETFQPDVILADYALPRFNGMKALKLALKYAPLSPVIIWTGAIKEDVAVDCMKAGASNYVLKENIKRLGPAILHALEERQLLLQRRQAEGKYQGLFENSAVGIFQSSLQGRYIHVNATMARIYGYDSPQEMIEAVKNISEQLYTDPARRTEFVAVVRSQGSVENYEQENYRKDGSVIWTSTTARAVCDPNGHILYYEGFVRDITTRKSVEKKLQESESKYRTLVEHLPAITYISKPDQYMGVRYISPQIQALGFSAEEWIADPELWFKHIHPEDQGRVLTALQQFQDGAPTFSTEYRLRMPNGETRWFHDRSIYVRDQNGEPILKQGFMLDITERKQAKEALRNGEERFRALIENGLDNISLLNADGTLIWESPAAIRMLDYAPDVFVGQNIFQLMHPDDLEWTRELYSRLIREPGCRQQGTFRLRHSNGTWRWVEAIVTNMLEEPSVNAIVVNYRDITERKQAEEALRESQAKYQKLVETSHDLIWSVDTDGRFTFVNRAAKDIYGYEPEELLGRSSFQFMDPNHYHHNLDRFKETIAQIEETQDVETYVQHRDGRQFILSTNSIVVRDELGKVISVTGSSHDITLRKRVEEVLNEERNLLRTLIDNLPDRIYAMDLQGRKTLSNTADWKASGGKTMEDVIGKTDFDTYPAELAEEFWHLDKLVLDTGQPVINHEEPGLDENGNLVSILTTKIPLQNGDGQVIGLVGIGRDITARKQAEERLRDSENRYRLATRATNDVIWEWNLQTDRLFWSENAPVIFGYATEEIGPDASWWDAHIHPEDRTRVLAKLDTLIAEKESIWMEEYRFLLKNGSYAYISDRGYIERDADGTPLRMIGAMSDITERKRSEIERQALLEIMQGLANTNDLQELLTLIHHAIARVVYAENFFVILYRPNTGLFEEIYSVDQYDPPGLPSKLEKSISSCVFRSGEPLLITQARFDELVAQNEVTLVGTDAKSWMGAPLKMSGKTIGVMAVQDYETDNRYSERDKEFLASIATQVALVIERKQAEEALRESEEHYRAIFEGVHDAIFVESTDGRILMVNERACEMFGYSRAEFLTKTVADLVPPGHPILMANDMDSPLTTQPAETLNLRANGEVFPIEVSGRLQVINGETILLVVVRDITERKQAETALLESITQFRTLFEASPDAIMLIDPTDDWPIVDCNTAACQMNGYSREELIGQCIDILNFTPGNPSERNQYIERVRKQGILRYETLHCRKDGATIAVDVSTSLIRVGNREMILGIDRDITERKRAETAEHEQRALAEALRDTAELLNSTLDYGEVLDHILKAVGRVVPHDAGTIMLIEGDNSRVVRLQGYDREGISSGLMGITLSLAETTNLQQMLETGQPIVVYDTHSYPGWKRLPATDWLRSNVGAPISIHGEVIGFICLDSQIPEYFTPLHAERLQAFANQAALAIHNARLLQQAQQEIMERRQAEEELRASEERFRQLADNIEEAFWMTEAETGRELYMSPAIEKIWGRPIASLMQEPGSFLYTVFPEDRARLLDAIEREKRGEKVETEYRIMRPDGSLRWVWDRAFPISDETGRVKKIAGISADVTERRESEMELIKSESRYRELFDSSPISIWEEDFSLVKKQIDLLLENGITDLENHFYSHPELLAKLASLVRINDANKAALEVYRTEHKTILLKRLTDIRSPDALSHFRDELLGLLSPAKRFAWEGTDRMLNGNQIEVIVNGSIPHGYEKDWSKVIVSVSDITERKRAEEEIRRRAEETAALLETSLALTNLDLNATLQTISSSAKTLFTADGCRVFLMEPDGETLRCVLALQENFAAFSDLKIKIGEGVTGSVAASGQAEIVNEMQNDPRAVQVPGTPEKEAEAIMFAPLKERDRTIGVLSIRRVGEERFFQPEDLELLEAFAAMAASAVSNARLFEETQHRLIELEALYENGLAIGRLLERRQIGEHIMQTFARYLRWHHVTIRLKREESDELELVAFNLPNLDEEQRAHTEQHFVTLVNKVGQGLSGWVLQTGEPLRTGNVHAHVQYINTHANIESGLYMPLKIGGRVIGVISVESEVPNAFSDQDERLLATLASQAAIAFENARLYEAIQKELSERKRAEEELRASEAHYRELADSITDVLFELDHNLQYTHWNKALEALTGIPVDEAIGRSMHEIFGESEEQVRIRKVYEGVLKNREPETFGTTLVVGGAQRTFEINAYPSRRGVSVVAKDVTDRKRSEIIMQRRFELMEYSAHHTLNELMQKTVDEVSELTGSTIGFFHFVEADQLHLGMQSWSTNALRLFNVPISEGAHLPLDQAGVWADAVRERRSLIQNDYESLSHKMGLPEGHVPIVREIVIPIIRSEKVVAVMGIGNKPQEYTQHDLEIAERLADYAWDITERKQMEIALEVERNQLARRVEERTADLSRANSNLARALRVKDEFLANMSHELRTPLNAILGLSESLAEQIAGPLNEKQQKYITTISESGHHLLSLINDILDLAKIEAGQITLDINKVDIHSVCQVSLRMIKQLAQKKNQEVTLKIEDGLGLMWADERRLKQMIVNLLGNAVKFTPENGKIGLQVQGDEEANKITITVWDNGIGIQEDDLTRLFQPFVQLDSGLARETTGTGLGLALVAQMARLHGGSVNAFSEPGVGSRFSIVLPWEPALALDSATRLRITGKFRAIKPDEAQKPTILLVEDTKEVIMMIQDYLELAGYRIVTAQDGIDAIVQAKLVQPDLILMDVQMPRMDGLEATRKLRSEPEFRYTPIIALTALAMPSDRERCLAAGMDEYISKPINLKALVKIIQSCLLSNEEHTPR